MENVAESRPLITIQAGAKAYWNLGEIWRDREILRGMVWRDIAVRYKETVIGFLWVVLQPLLMMFILSMFASQLGRGTTTGIPVHLRVFASLLMWDFVSMSVERAGVSLMTNAAVISKLYFCRLILPLTPIGACTFDLVIKLGILAVMMAIEGIVPSLRVLLVPLVLVCAILFTASVSIWLAALTAFYKDIALTIPFLLRALFFLSPVFYEASQLITPEYQDLYHLNPIAALIESFNYLVLGTDVFPVVGILTTLLTSIILLITGVFFFRCVETSIVDVL